MSAIGFSDSTVADLSLRFSRSNEDDLTVKLTEIVFMNAVIKTGLAKGVTTQNLMVSLVGQSEFELALIPAIPLRRNNGTSCSSPSRPTSTRSCPVFLPPSCVAMRLLVDTAADHLVATSQGQKPIRGFCQRLKGKQGRFRGNLSGKRVDFSARTVISPDPNLQIDQVRHRALPHPAKPTLTFLPAQVAVPERVCKILTFPDRVTPHNIEVLRAAVRNGTEVHPGANFILQGGQEQFKKFLKFGDKEFMADKLRVGDVVERHLRDNE